MIDYGLFVFAGAPRTATTWIRHAAADMGFLSSGRVHEPHSADSSKIRLSTVRHPADWLQSYYAEIWPGQIQIDCVDGLRRACNGTESFDDFIRLYLDGSWTVGGMFAAYGADMMIRVEDLPWAFFEFAGSVGVCRASWDKCLLIRPANASRKKKPEWNPLLRARVCEKEADFMERYEY